MKLSSVLTTLTATATALSILEPDQAVLGGDAKLEQFLIELGPGDTRWISEDEKWELRRVRFPANEAQQSKAGLSKGASC